MVVHDVVAIGVDCRDQATVDIIFVAGHFHAPGIGDIRQEMLVVIAELRLVPINVRYRNKIFSLVIEVRNKMSRGAADLRNPVLRVAFKDNGFSIRILTGRLILFAILESAFILYCQGSISLTNGCSYISITSANTTPSSPLWAHPALPFLISFTTTPL
jgi:hypothetical protein